MQAQEITAFNQFDLLNIKNAVEAGDSYVQLVISMMYELGSGVHQDFAAAIEWCSLSAGQGNPYAQQHLGVLHFLDIGVPRDPVKGMAWVLLASSASGKYWDDFEIIRRILVPELTTNELEEAIALCRVWYLLEHYPKIKRPQRVFLKKILIDFSVLLSQFSNSFVRGHITLRI